MSGKALAATTLLWAWAAAAQTAQVARIDVNSALREKVASVSNSAFDIGALTNIFDGDENSLARTPAINPMVVTLTFKERVELRGSRILSKFHNSEWTLETADSEAELASKSGTYRILVNKAVQVNGQWGTATFAAREARAVRLTCRRTTGDNYVHLNEWELTATLRVRGLSIAPVGELKPTWRRTTALRADSDWGPYPMQAAQISWSSANPEVVMVDPSGVVFGVSEGAADIVAEIRGSTAKLAVRVSGGERSSTPGDVLVGWIARLPEIDYVERSTNPRVQGWPQTGAEVIWRAVVRSYSSSAREAVPYKWSLDGEDIEWGTVTIPAFGTANVDLKRPWSFERKNLRFHLDPDATMEDEERANNTLAVATDALSVAFYVEESHYNYFREHQFKLGVGANSWEDWAERQVARWNEMFAAAIYPETPEGVKDRIRIQKIVVTPDGSLPLAGGLPTNHPNLKDKTVDLQWGFPAIQVSADNPFYKSTGLVSDTNPFYFEGSLIHELGHARYLIDVYGFDVSAEKGGENIEVKEGGSPVVGGPQLPFLAWNILYYGGGFGMMHGEYTYVDRYSAVMLNRIAGQRAVAGNTNAPGNLGEFLYDLPADNELTILDAAGTPVPGAKVELFQARPYPVWYGKSYRAQPDVTLTTDSAGKVRVGKNPFSGDGRFSHTYGHANTTLLLRVEGSLGVAYGWLDVSSFNLEYARGNRGLGRHTLRLRFAGGAGCAAELSASTTELPAAGGTGLLRITAAQGCAWTVQGANSWIIFEPASGSGDGLVRFRVQPNTGEARAAALTVMGSTIQLTQAGTPTGEPPEPEAD